MSAAVSQAVQSKIAQLQSSKYAVETRLRNERQESWDEDHWQRQINLVDQRDQIDAELYALQQQLASIGKDVQLRTVDVEVDGSRKTYTVVPSELVSPKAGMISFESPLARALLNCTAGETVTVNTPFGIKTYRVLKIV